MSYDKVEVTGRTLNELVETYETLISKVVHDKYIDYPGLETSNKCKEKLLDWLRSTDFYRAPASTIFHESVVGGLLVHTLNVYNNAITLQQFSPQFKNVDPVSVALVALTHDWCKIGLYESYEKNVKNEQTGQWEKQTAFRINQIGVPLGHGVSSMFLASKFFRLTTDEALAIRWHMGAFRVLKEEINEMQMANENYPLVHLIQFADSLSITTYANTSI